MERDLARGHELDHRWRLTGSDVLIGADHDARLGRREPPALAGTVHVPLPLHAHVGVKDDVLAVSGERDQEVLAVRLDGLHRSSDDLPARGRRSHLRRDKLEPRDNAPGERATEHGRGAKDRVALGHAAARRARRAGDSREAFARSRPREARRREATRPRERRRPTG